MIGGVKNEYGIIGPAFFGKQWFAAATSEQPIIVVAYSIYTTSIIEEASENAKGEG